LYASTNIIKVIESKRMRWEGHLVRMGKIKNSYKIFVGKPEGKRQLGIARHRWEVTLEWTLGNVRLKNVE
jgi:hypothetical protein